MPRIPSRPYPFRLARRLREDDGFGLIEVLVSAVLLTALALATFKLIDGSHQASAAVRSRSVAADIAHDDLNRLRQMKFSIVSGTNYQSKTSTPGVDGVNYTVTSTVTWATDTGVETSCTVPATAGSSQYLRIRSTVTWPAMGSIKPVVADSIMAPRGREANRTTGALMVKVADRDAKPVSGAAVTVSGQSLTTNTNGCVFFPAVNAGQWPVTIAKGSFMDSDGNSPGAATASVVVNDVSTLAVSFDNPAKFSPVTYADEASTPVAGATWPWFTITNASKTLPFAGTATNPVFPFASGWSIFAGRCAGNNPALYSNNPWPSLTDSTFNANPGQTVPDGKAYMRMLTLNLSDSKYTGTGLKLDYVITTYTDSTYTYMTGCNDAPATGTVTVSGTGTQTKVIPVPYGLYSICVDNQNTGYGSTNVNKSTGYRYKRFVSGTAPTNAFHATPTRTGVTLKNGVPAPDNSTWNATLDGTNVANSPQC
jgi:Tfp pilus assembly protein PilV